MALLPLDNPPAIEGTPTMKETGAPPPHRITLTEPRRETTMSEAEQAELEAFRLQGKDGKPVIAVTTRQLTSLVTVLTTIASIILGGGYFTMSSQVEAVVDQQVDSTVATKVVEDVAVKDAANRQIVKEELAAVMVKVDARVDKDQKAFAKQIGDISDAVTALDERMRAQEKATSDQKTKFDEGLKAVESTQKKLTGDIIRAIEANK